MRFSLGHDFPAEGFVQEALERHFSGHGFILMDEGHTDLVCVHPASKERWVIEAKGGSKAVGVDFNTCLGQLLKRMTNDERAHFGLAVPAIPAYLRQLRLISSRVRHSLAIHWLLVAPDSQVTVIGPDEPLP